MTYKWIEDRFKQDDDEAPFETVTNMLLEFEQWCETEQLNCSEALRRAEALKQMFDAGDFLVKEGFEPPQISLILQHHFGREG